MKKSLKNYREAMSRTRGIFAQNPVLIGGLALPIAIMGTTSLMNAVALSIAAFATIVPLMLVASTAGKYIPLNLRRTCYVLLAAAILCGVSYPIGKISPGIFDSLGIYYSLMAVNTILLYRTETYAHHASPLAAVVDGLRNSLGFSLVICVMAILREVVGKGTLWGRPVQTAIVLPSVLLPFFGFIFLGMCCAGAKGLSHLMKSRLIRDKLRGNMQGE